MDYKRLKKAEKDFLKRYPGGFAHPEMLEIGKKHKMDKMVNQTKEWFAKARFKDTDEIVNSMVKTVTQSSMVSLFEKPKFRDTVKEMTPGERESLAKGLKKLLHGNEKKGFEEVLDLLVDKKMAKWTLMTVVQNYYRPDKEVFVKPSTVKSVIQELGIDLLYKPRPSWEFYEAYRTIINDIKERVDPSLTDSNAAFCGFLMFTLGGWGK